MDEVRRLALEISSCCEVSQALKDESHPCHGVVNWQAEQWQPPILQIENSTLHRPEAWTGNLSLAPILFLSSNPSFDSKENYPNWKLDEWPLSKVEDFAIRRFTSEIERGYGGSDGLSSEKIDRTIGKNGELLHKVTYWNWARSMVAYIYGKKLSEISAHKDFIMTEIVHCKSKGEQGVKKARSKCKDKYLERLLELSNARLIIISGKHACADIKAIYPDNFPEDWGLWDKEGSTSTGFWPMKIERFPIEVAAGKWSLEVQSKHSTSFQVGGQLRTFQYFAKSGGWGLNAPWNYPELVHPKILNNWRELVKQN